MGERSEEKKVKWKKEGGKRKREGAKWERRM